MFCPKCGHPNNKEGLFCGECGADISHVSAPEPAAALKKPENAGPWIALSIAFSLIALLFCPLLFGGLSIYFGYRVHRAGNEKLGTILMIVAGGCMMLGFLIGLFVYGFFKMRHVLP